MLAPAFWNEPKRGLLAQGLRPLAAIYGVATARRMARPGVRLPVPVVCIGNFTAGGAGKTPVAAEVARLLQASGERVFILARGYGGARRVAPLWVEPRLHSAAETGDEPLLLAETASVIIGADRVESARLAILLGATVLVMDDGLQNPALAKSLTLAVVDGAVGAGNGLCLPAGPLRAPLAAQLPFVDAVVLIGARQAGEDLARDCGKPVFRADLVPDAEVAALLAERKVVAFAGIGRPEKFFATLEALGAHVASRHAFGDHHVYSPAELIRIGNEAAREGALAVTTRKDFARIPERLRPPGLLALPVALAFGDAAAVMRMVTSALAAFKPSG